MNIHGAGGEDEKEKVVLMWGYLPGSSPQRSPLLSPAAVRLPQPVGGDAWKDVCGGGCGFAMAISGNLDVDLLLVLDFCLWWSRMRMWTEIYRL